MNLSKIIPAVVLALVVLTSGVELFAQNYFEAIFQTSGSIQAQSVVLTSDSGIVFCGGYLASSGGGAGGATFIAKLDSNANLEWSKGFPSPSFVSLNDMVETADGNIAIVGAAYRDTQLLNAGIVVKMDPAGSILWTLSIGDTADFIGNAIAQASSGDLVIAGECVLNDNRELWVARVSSTGNLIWSFVYQGSVIEYADDVVVRDNGNIVVGGTTNSFGAGGGDMLLMELDSSGNQIQAVALGGSNNERCHGIAETTDGRIIAVGHTRSMGQMSDAFAVRVDEQLNVQWARAINLWNHPSGNDFAYGISSTEDGGAVVCGVSSSEPITSSSWKSTIFKINGQGGWEWGRAYGESDRQHFNSVEPKRNGGYIAVGATRTQMMEGMASIHVFDEFGLGCQVAETMFGADTIEPTTTTGSFVSLPFGTPITIQISDDSSSGAVQIACSGSVSVDPILDQPLLTVAPNPFQISMQISSSGLAKQIDVKVFNSLGELVRDFNLSPGNVLTFYREGLSSGIYYLHATNNRQRAVYKVVIMD